MSYYGFRFYKPETGRWPSRDPIGEQINPRTFVFADNSPITKYDFLGLASCSERCPNAAKVVMGANGQCNAKYRTTGDLGLQKDMNGCGTEQTDVPDVFLGLVSFTEACNHHDVCYQQCGSSKTACDFRLGAEMRAACSKIPWFLKPTLYQMCLAQADIYVIALLASGEAKQGFEHAHDINCRWRPCCFSTR